jgi:hypothetical protein
VDEAVKLVGLEQRQILAATLENAANVTSGARVSTCKDSMDGAVEALLTDSTSTGGDIDDSFTTSKEAQGGEAANGTTTQTLHEYLSACEESDVEQRHIADRLEAEATSSPQSPVRGRRQSLARARSNAKDVMQEEVFDHDANDDDGKYFRYIYHNG